MLQRSPCCAHSAPPPSNSPPSSLPLQAAEGKLGRAYEYHRAPAPFVQLELLRLLAALGAGDKGASENMYAVIAEVKRRAEPLGNNIGGQGGGGQVGWGWLGGGWMEPTPKSGWQRAPADPQHAPAPPPPSRQAMPWCTSASRRRQPSTPPPC